jgi:uncharacterized protein YbbC (DUF1343 family)
MMNTVNKILRYTVQHTVTPSIKQRVKTLLALHVMALTFVSYSVFSLNNEGLNPSLAPSASSHNMSHTFSVGAQRFEHYLPLLENKRVALVVNQSALVPLPSSSKSTQAEKGRSVHLLDALLQRGVNVRAIMSPEHGFRGDKGAGEKINNTVDSKTGLPIHSLYGKTQKPTSAMLQDIDVVVFDIQDVGVRFYTYLSTLHYVIEAAFAHDIDVVVLDRPNPNGRFVDGPVLEPAFSSFVGMHPIPVLHGMTLGELAQMIVGEMWIDTPKESRASLSVVPIANYSRNVSYSLPVAPSPNLPNDAAIQFYPTLCFYEGTDVSIGRGTDFPFQLVGHPLIELGQSSISVSANDAAPYPKHENATLFAHIFSADKVSMNNKDVPLMHFDHTLSGLDLELLIATYRLFKMNRKDGINFFTRPEFFDKLAGTNRLREMIEDGKSAEQIRQSWQENIVRFKAQRQPYLLYPE